jgi:hypothetical protein
MKRRWRHCLCQIPFARALGDRSVSSGSLCVCIGIDGRRTVCVPWMLRREGRALPANGDAYSAAVFAFYRLSRTQLHVPLLGMASATLVHWVCLDAIA